MGPHLSELALEQLNALLRRQKTSTKKVRTRVYELPISWKYLKPLLLGWRGIHKRQNFCGETVSQWKIEWKIKNEPNLFVEL